MATHHKIITIDFIFALWVCVNERELKVFVFPQQIRSDKPFQTKLNRWSRQTQNSPISAHEMRERTCNYAIATKFGRAIDYKRALVGSISIQMLVFLFFPPSLSLLFSVSCSSVRNGFWTLFKTRTNSICSRIKYSNVHEIGHTNRKLVLNRAKKAFYRCSFIYRSW